MVGVVVAILAAFFADRMLGEMVSIGTLLAFMIVCVGVWVLRRAAARIWRGRSARRVCRWCRSWASCSSAHDVSWNCRDWIGLVSGSSSGW